MIMAVMMTAIDVLDAKSYSLENIPMLGAGAPEPAKCSVGGMLRGCNGGWCLVRPIPGCQFGFVYGFGFLCRHPEIEHIIARTHARKPSRQR